MFTPKSVVLPSVELFPYFDEGDVVIDSSINGVASNPARLQLAQLFTDYLDYRRVRHESTIAPPFRGEVMETIALLRSIAREMEIELDGSHEGLQ